MHLSSQDTAQIKATLIQILAGYRVTAKDIHRCLVLLDDRGQGSQLARQIVAGLAPSRSGDKNNPGHGIGKGEKC
jgi:hypothetical protein